MGSRVLVGAIVGAFFVWGGVFALVQQRNSSIALAAPERAARRQSPRVEAANLERAQRAALAPDEPQPGHDPEETGPPPPLTPAMIASLIADLRDDDVRGNAEAALCMLEMGGNEVVEPLQAALRSNDWQQRQLAGYVLALRAYLAPTQALASVLLEALDDGPLPHGPLHDPMYPHVASVTTSAWVHECAADRLRTDTALFALVEPRVALRLNSDSPYARVEAAFLLALHRSELARPRVLSTLIRALEDNEVEGDARLALRGLVHLGDAARESLEYAWPGRDAQQHALIGHLLSQVSPQCPGAHALAPEDFTRMGLPVGDPLRRGEYGLEP